MKKLIFPLFILLVVTSCSYTTGSGNILSETRTVENFDGISVGGGFDVEVKIGTATSVVVEADDNIIKYIKTSTSGNTLRIETEDLHNYSDVHMKVFITTPALNRVNASASAEVDIVDVLTSTGKLIFKSSSGATVKAEIDAPAADAEASSGASITLNGKTKSYSAEASSGADIKSWDLLSENTKVNVSSGAGAKVHASVSLNASASSGATITYHGGAALEKSVSSGGEVIRKD